MKSRDERGLYRSGAGWRARAQVQICRCCMYTGVCLVLDGYLYVTCVWKLIIH